MINQALLLAVVQVGCLAGVEARREVISDFNNHVISPDFTISSFEKFHQVSDPLCSSFSTIYGSVDTYNDVVHLSMSCSTSNE